MLFLAIAYTDFVFFKLCNPFLVDSQMLSDARFWDYFMVFFSPLCY